MSVYLASIKIVPIKAANDHDEQIYLSSNLINRLGINKNHELHIYFGKKMKLVKVEARNIPRDEIHLSEPILHVLSMPYININFLAKHIVAKQMLYLGPIVALVTEFQSSQAEGPNFRSIHAFCKELHQTATKVGGFFYVFTYHDFSDEGVDGYYFENDKWVFAKLPFPDVVYNRIHSRKSEQTALFKKFRGSLERFGIPLFNDRFLSKWEVYQHLMLENHIQPYIPETRLLSQEALHELIDQYDAVFIKPIHGSQGRNIIKLVKEGEHIIFQTSKAPLLNQPTKKYSSKEVFYQLKPFLHNRIYIIQQGISLVKYQDKSMDFRALVHRNQDNLWEVTSLVARISAEQQLVSNLAKGGKIMKPLLALTTCFNQETSLQLLSVMRDLSIKAADIVSRNTNGVTGELGIDIGVDDTGRPWIIEVNSKPSKNFEDTLTKIRPSAKAIIQFCTKLALDGVLEMEEY